jgi:hypothetical protein
MAATRRTRAGQFVFVALIVAMGFESNTAWQPRDPTCSRSRQPSHLSQLKREVPSEDARQFGVARRAVSSEMKRRDVFAHLVAFAGVASVPVPALAATGERTNQMAASGSQSSARKPFAHVESLLPAVSFRLVLDTAVRAAERAASSESRQDQVGYLQTLADLLLTPQNYKVKVSAVPDQPAQQFLETYRQRRGELSLIEQPGALLVQNGEIGAWRRLKRQERGREENDEIRAALNAYTNDLSFRSDSYIFNESKELKSKLVREDRLPDVKEVISSDLGLRYLYRNDVLTFMDDARAELRYLLKDTLDPGTSSAAPLDLSELKSLLSQADGALVKWFSFIDDDEVRRARDALASL